MAAPLFLTRLARDPWARFGLGLVASLAILALLAPWLAPGDPFRGHLAASLRPPSHNYLFGSHAQRRDVLSRVGSSTSTPRAHWALRTLASSVAICCPT